MQKQDLDFILFVKEILGYYFNSKIVLDISISDINRNNNKHLFQNCLYLSNDISKIKDLAVNDNTFDTIISTEYFQYDPEYKESLKKIYNMLKPNGLFCFTCAGIECPIDLNKVFSENNYYKNLTEYDLNEVIPLNELFFTWDTYYNEISKHFYFVGIKKGRLNIDILTKYKNDGIICTSDNINKIQKSYNINEIGFIILRHVNNSLSANYWVESYDCIRKLYPENKIIIIDDNSNYDFIIEKDLYNTKIIQSEFIGRGELLPYYYYLNNKLFDIAVIIHDSVFINKLIDFTNFNNFKFLWEFEHHWDQIEDENRMIQTLNDSNLYKFYLNKNLWKGCFGSMSIIKHDYLLDIHNKYNINKLLDLVINRYNRSSFERIIACLLQINNYDNNNISLFGNIHSYCNNNFNCIWNFSYFDYKNNIQKYNELPIIKVWTGR